MEQTVYVDLYFLINMSMDFVCFFITSRLLSQKLHTLRALAGAAIGGAYACAALLLGVGGVLGMVADILACTLICAVAVWRRGETVATLGYSVVYCACSIAMGGLMTVLFSLMNRLGIGDGVVDEDGISVWTFALLAAVSGAVSALGVKAVRRRGGRRRGQVEIEYKGRKKTLRAICDSGNMLTDPISGRPCVVVEREELMAWLSDGAQRAVREGRVEGLEHCEAERIRLIPTKTALGSGLMYALRVDGIRVDMGGGWQSVDALVALGELGESAEGARALVPAVLALGAP